MKLRLTSSLVGAVTSESFDVFLYMTGIYKIISPSGKVYIGQAVDIERRWKEHQRESTHCKYKLYNSFRKYGVNNHTFEVVEECSREELNSKERYYQDKFNVLEEGLNQVLQPAKEAPRILSEETKRKISESKKGAPAWNKGKPRSEEAKRKISSTLTGRKLSEEVKHNIAKGKRGKSRTPHSEETKRKISETKKGKRMSEETKRKISEAMKEKKKL